MKIKTQNEKAVNKKNLIAAIDIGMKVHHGYFRAANGKEVKPFEFSANREGFEEFWRKLCRFKEEVGVTDVVIGFESTGPYAEPLVHYLREKAVKLVQINPMHTKRMKKLRGNSPNKTDKKDPRVIADIISIGCVLQMVVPEGAAAELRRLTQARERAMKKRTVMLNQLQQLVFIIFPEFLRIMKVSSKTGMHLIKHYTTAGRIRAMGIGSVREVLRKVSRGKLGKERAEQLFSAACSSVGVREGEESIVLEIRHLVSAIETEERFIEEVEEKMQWYLEKIAYSKNIMSIKGIGVITTAGLIGEVADFKKFGSPAEVAGLDLYEISSGSKRGRRHISKRGRSLLRKLLFFAAINTVRKNGVMHRRYKQMIERGMPKTKALIAVARKLVGIIFALVRDNTMYEEEYSPKHCVKLATPLAWLKAGRSSVAPSRRYKRPSSFAYTTPRCHPSPNKARLEPLRTLKTRIGQG